MVRIGKLLPDGTVRHIKLERTKGHDVTSSVLKNFYSTVERIDALLELGDLVYLGASPKGNWKGKGDDVNCCALIRDCGEKLKFCRSQLAIDRENFSNQEELSYLFDNGAWHGMNNGRKEILSPFCLSGLFKEKPSLEKLHVYGNKKSEYHALPSRNFSTWEEMLEAANEEKQSFFVFRKDKLICIVNPVNRLKP